MSQALKTPHHAIAPELRGLEGLIDEARGDIKFYRLMLRARINRLHRLHRRRDELLARADTRFQNNLQDPAYGDALESALSGDGPLTEKLATGMRLCADCGAGVAPEIDAELDPDPDDEDQPTDDDDGDDAVLRTEAGIDYDTEGRTAAQLLHDRHGDDTESQMAAAFAQDTEQWTREMSAHERREFHHLQPISQEVYTNSLNHAQARDEHEAMTEIHGGDPSDERYLDAGGDA